MEAWSLGLGAARIGVVLALLPLGLGWASGLAARAALVVAAAPLLARALTDAATLTPRAAVLLHELLAGLALGLATRALLSTGLLVAHLTASLAPAAPRAALLDARGAWPGLLFHLGLVTVFVSLDGPLVLIEGVAATLRWAPPDPSLAASGPVVLRALAMSAGVLVVAVGVALPLLVSAAIIDVLVGLTRRFGQPLLLDAAPASSAARLLALCVGVALVLRPVLVALSGWLFDTTITSLAPP